ncbi:MAG: Rpn family recombination-promoting nuclease/putative transposase [Lachnospiraceae bacterium]|nr:Rpn family recombination-promoting nuclease/putative transposase [Lachnospiraceae bacterium]
MKTLQELTLTSKFLFDQTMDIPEAHEAALQIILQNELIKLLTPSQTEKEIRTMPWLRSIRLDVYAMDQDNTLYNTEMQAERKGDLIKRSRYYQGLIDSSLLEPGNVNFNKLNNTCIIMITPFDLFGEGKYQYTFRSYCEEKRELELGDGAVRIFLNTRGTNNKEVNKELVDFLHYIEKTDDESAEAANSERIRLIHECVRKIKSSEEMGVKYMQLWEEKVYEREEGREEGKVIGEAVGKAIGKAEAVLEILQEFGEVPEELKDCILAQQDITVLNSWLKAAIKADSIGEFEKLLLG